MKTVATKATADTTKGTLFVGDDWFDPLETGVRTRIRGFIETSLEKATRRSGTMLWRRCMDRLLDCRCLRDRSLKRGGDGLGHHSPIAVNLCTGNDVSDLAVVWDHLQP